MHPLIWVGLGLLLLTKKAATPLNGAATPGTGTSTVPSAQLQAMAAAAVQKALQQQQASAPKPSGGSGSGSSAPSSLAAMGSNQAAKAIAQAGATFQVPPGVDPTQWAAAVEAVNGLDSTNNGSAISFDTQDATASDTLESVPAPTDFTWNPPAYNADDPNSLGDIATVDAPDPYTWTPPQFDESATGPDTTANDPNAGESPAFDNYSNDTYDGSGDDGGYYE